MNLWQQQIREKEDGKKRAREERILREKQELEAEMNYNPFGKDRRRVETEQPK